MLWQAKNFKKHLTILPYRMNILDHIVIYNIIKEWENKCYQACWITRMSRLIVHKSLTMSHTTFRSESQKKDYKNKHCSLMMMLMRMYVYSRESEILWKCVNNGKENSMMNIERSGEHFEWKRCINRCRSDQSEPAGHVQGSKLTITRSKVIVGQSMMHSWFTYKMVVKLI